MEPSKDSNLELVYAMRLEEKAGVFGGNENHNTILFISEFSTFASISVSMK